MKLPDLISTGWVEISAHKMRSFLSFFAISIGIATFFYTLSILSQSYRRLDRTEQVSGTGRLDTSTNNALTLAQYQELVHALPKTASVSIESERFFASLTYRGKELSSSFYIGILPTWKEADFAYRLEGRFINWSDIQNKRRVALITVFPHEKKRQLWKHSWRGRDGIPTTNLSDFTQQHNLLGQQIMLEDEQFTVVGLLHAPELKDDARIGESRDFFSRVLIPYTTWLDMQPSWHNELSTQIRIVTGKKSSVHQAAAKTISFLRSQFGLNEKPEIEFMDEILEKYRKAAFSKLKEMLFMGLIAMIAGGIGIMNVTMVVIFSRTKEIGIRRALGATRRDILFQFVVEAMLLGFCGSVVGMLLGYAAVLHMANNTQQMTFAWWVVVLSILIALVTSFLFALYPAWQASKLRPVDALKYE